MQPQTNTKDKTTDYISGAFIKTLNN